MGRKKAKPYCYEYPRPALTVDCAVFGLDEELRVLLVQRDLPPFEGGWALPGGFVQMEETLDDAARRELREETGLDRAYLEQVRTFGAVDRDPRGRVVTVAYYALVRIEGVRLDARTDARAAAWFSIHDLPELAFDHQGIFDVCLDRLRMGVRREPIGFDLLPRKFTLTQLQSLYEQVLGRELDRRNFRKKILAMDLLVDLNEVQQDVAHRAARLYGFDPGRYRKLRRTGFSFHV